MATLVSPGVSTSLINQSFFIPVSSTTVPLLFVATKAGKLQANGITPAAGTLEHSVVRTVTSKRQSLDLYGIPDFRRDSTGNEFHGDARNEYGLLALNHFLGVGNRAYVVRCNINLDDKPQTFYTLGTPKLQGDVYYDGLGSGNLSNIVAVSDQVRPQEFRVVFATPDTFAVSGSQSGYVGPGVVGVPFTSTQVRLHVNAGTVPFVAGDNFSFTMGYQGEAEAGNVGNGQFEEMLVGDLTLAQTFTIQLTSQNEFTVTGSVTGAGGTGFVNSPFDNNMISFVLSQGTTPFVDGDTFTVTMSQVVIGNPLGASDAQRRLAIVTALQAEINSNMEVRSPLYEYNLILCPGYPEVVDEMIALSVDVKEEAMVIADTPGNQNPEQVAQWAMTSERFMSENAAYYYPWCLMSNMDGKDVLGAPSGAALRTITYSDNAGYVWDAPAGVSNSDMSGISKVGYFTGRPGTATAFIESNLNDGQRDNLYEYNKNINPFVFFPGRGLLVWGQKTSAPAASAHDRINVMRLVMYLRRALRKGAVPFVFKPNDFITRGDLKAAGDSILNDIMIKRGLYDFFSQCDEGNNGPDRIDRNEMWYDVAIKPTKAAEFIYIPIRTVNTGAAFT